MKLVKYASNMREAHMDDGSKLLISYDTPVAAYVPGVGYFRTDLKWSVTTSKHITRWLFRSNAPDVRYVPQRMLTLSFAKGVSILAVRMLEAAG